MLHDAINGEESANSHLYRGTRLQLPPRPDLAPKQNSVLARTRGPTWQIQGTSPCDAPFGRGSMAARRDENYVDGAEFEDSDELIEENSDDSDEFHALPSLAHSSVKSTLTLGSKRKAGEAHDDAAASGSASRTEKRKQSQKNAGYSWEAAYQRSWDHVQEDESGNLESAVRQMLEVSKRKRSLRDSAPVQRGIIRHLVLVLDLSEDMMDRDLRPTRYVPLRKLTSSFDLTLQLCRQFVSDYFDQNPIGQLAIVCARDGLAERLSLMGGNTFDHGAVLASKRKLEPRGEPSLQNALEMARNCLSYV